MLRTRCGILFGRRILAARRAKVAARFGALDVVESKSSNHHVLLSINAIYVIVGLSRLCHSMNSNNCRVEIVSTSPLLHMLKATNKTDRSQGLLVDSSLTQAVRQLIFNDLADGRNN